MSETPHSSPPSTLALGLDKEQLNALLTLFTGIKPLKDRHHQRQVSPWTQILKKATITAPLNGVRRISSLKDESPLSVSSLRVNPISNVLEPGSGLFGVQSHQLTLNGSYITVFQLHTKSEMESKSEYPGFDHFAVLIPPQGKIEATQQKKLLAYINDKKIATTAFSINGSAQQDLNHRVSKSLLHHYEKNLGVKPSHDNAAIEAGLKDMSVGEYLSTLKEHTTTFKTPDEKKTFAFFVEASFQRGEPVSLHDIVKKSQGTLSLDICKNMLNAWYRNGLAAKTDKDFYRLEQYPQGYDEKAHNTIISTLFAKKGGSLMRRHITARDAVKNVGDLLKTYADHEFVPETPDLSKYPNKIVYDALLIGYHVAQRPLTHAEIATITKLQLPLASKTVRTLNFMHLAQETEWAAVDHAMVEPKNIPLKYVLALPNGRKISLDPHATETPEPTESIPLQPAPALIPEPQQTPVLKEAAPAPLEMAPSIATDTTSFTATTESQTDMTKTNAKKTKKTTKPSAKTKAIKAIEEHVPQLTAPKEFADYYNSLESVALKDELRPSHVIFLASLIETKIIKGKTNKAAAIKNAWSYTSNKDLILWAEKITDVFQIDNPESPLKARPDYLSADAAYSALVHKQKMNDITPHTYGQAKEQPKQTKQHTKAPEAFSAHFNKLPEIDLKRDFSELLVPLMASMIEVLVIDNKTSMTAAYMNAYNYAGSTGLSNLANTFPEIFSLERGSSKINARPKGLTADAAYEALTQKQTSRGMTPRDYPSVKKQALQSTKTIVAQKGDESISSSILSDDMITSNTPQTVELPEVVTTPEPKQDSVQPKREEQETVVASVQANDNDNKEWLENLLTQETSYKTNTVLMMTLNNDDDWQNAEKIQFLYQLYDLSNNVDDMTHRMTHDYKIQTTINTGSEHSLLKAIPTGKAATGEHAAELYFLSCGAKIEHYAYRAENCEQTIILFQDEANIRENKNSPDRKAAQREAYQKIKKELLNETATICTTQQVVNTLAERILNSVDVEYIQKKNEALQKAQQILGL